MICLVGAIIALLGPTLVLSDCGKKPAGARVINGQNAQPHSWPWQISLRPGNRYHSCGGTLISDRWVVTAAHCIHRNKNPSGYTVRVGGHDQRTPTSVQQNIGLSQIIEHPQYDNNRINNDIALLQLAKPVKFDPMGKVGTACLTAQRPNAGKRCYITGWGRTLSGTPNILQQAMLPLASHADCKRKYGSVSSVAHLCAGEARSGASGGCNGDSGGPLVCEENGKWYLHGAVSFGKRNCPTTHYTVFARVASYTDWIKQNTGVGTDGGGNPPPPPPTNQPPPPPTNQPPPPPPPTNQPPPPPPPTNQPPPPPPTSSPDCKDRASNCQRLKPYCSQSSIKNNWCRKTCGTCSGGGGGGGGGCKDTSRNCQRYKHLCKRNRYVRKHCKKTCNLPC